CPMVTEPFLGSTSPIPLLLFLPHKLWQLGDIHRNPCCLAIDLDQCHQVAQLIRIQMPFAS
ncbi:MAG TPA: hypothetical protein VKG24_10340, partial [Pseudolabrys sp.]|nr:hypothetical protein [Pseudolabrys sp.]